MKVAKGTSEGQQYKFVLSKNMYEKLQVDMLFLKI